MDPSLKDTLNDEPNGPTTTRV